MAKIDVDKYDAEFLREAAHAIGDCWHSSFLNNLAVAVENAVVPLANALEEIPGPDGQPDYVGPTYKVRP